MEKQQSRQVKRFEERHYQKIMASMEKDAKAQVLLGMISQTTHSMTALVQRLFAAEAKIVDLTRRLDAVEKPSVG